MLGAARAGKLSRRGGLALGAAQAAKYWRRRQSALGEAVADDAGVGLFEEGVDGGSDCFVDFLE